MTADLSAIRERLQNSVNWMMEGRNTGPCPGVGDFRALIEVLDNTAAAPSPEVRGAALLPQMTTDVQKDAKRYRGSAA